MKFGQPFANPSVVLYSNVVSLPVWVSPLFNVQGYASIIISPTEVWSAGTGTPIPREWAVDWYLDDAGTIFLTTDSALFSDTNVQPGPSKNLLWLKVKGASFKVRMLNSGGGPVSTITVQIEASRVAPAVDTYYQDNAFFGVSGASVFSDATDNFWAIGSNGIATGNPLIEYPPTKAGQYLLVFRLNSNDANGVQLLVRDALTLATYLILNSVTTLGTTPVTFISPRRPLRIDISHNVSGLSSGVQLTCAYQGG